MPGQQVTYTFDLVVNDYDRVRMRLFDVSGTSLVPEFEILGVVCAWVHEILVDLAHLYFRVRDLLARYPR